MTKKLDVIYTEQAYGVVVDKTITVNKGWRYWVSGENGVGYVINQTTNEWGWPIVGTINGRIGDIPLIELPDELEQLALKEYPEIKASTTFENGTREGYRVEYDDNEEFREGFIKGYKANKGKYSEEDIRRAMIYALSAAFENPDLDEGGKPVNDLITTYINLQTKRPIKIVLEYVERDVDFSGNTNYLQILKTSIDNTIKPLEVEWSTE